MSANNVVWLMKYTGFWHVFYSGCIDKTPTVPDYKDEYYMMFEERSKASIYAHGVVRKIDTEYAKEGYIGVEYGVCIVPRTVEEDVFNKSKPVLDALAISSKTVTNKDIQDFVHLVESMVGDLQTELITKENRIKERLCTLEEGLKDANKRIDWRMEEIKKLSTTKRKDGCYQFTYCNECMAYPMGLGCPNLTKGPIQLKKPDDEKPAINCSHCNLYGQCDHQGAYKEKNGKWCYEGK